MTRNLLLITEDDLIADHITDFLPPAHQLAVMPTVAAARAFLLHADEPDADDIPPRMGDWVIAYGSDVVEDYAHDLVPDEPLDPGWGSAVMVAAGMVTLGLFQATTVFLDAPLCVLPGDTGWRELIRELQRPPQTTCQIRLPWPA